MTSPSVLALLDFTKPFTIQCDASGCSIGGVLLRQGRPITFMSQALKERALNLSTSEKELLALVLVVRKW